jgi:hypothetical protein
MSKKKLVGTWKLISWKIKSADAIIYPFGEDAIGYIMYNEDGYMSVAVMTADRSHFTSNDILSGSQEEKAAATETHISYCGTYEVRKDEIIHHVKVSSFPNWTGVAQQRTFELNGNSLLLSAPRLLNEDEHQTVLFVWERVCE